MYNNPKKLSMTTQDNICDNQNNHPSQTENDLINSNKGAKKPVIKAIKTMIALLKLSWGLIALISFLYVIGIRNQIIVSAISIISLILNVMSVVTFIFFWFELRIYDWIDANS